MQDANSVALPESLTAAILETAPLLATDLATAGERARAILDSVPGQPHALALLTAARHLANDLPGARTLLEEMAAAAPRLAAVQYRLGLVLSELGETEKAIAALSRVADLEPAHAEASRALADALARAGRTAEAALAYARYFEACAGDLHILDPDPSGGKETLQAAEAALCAWLEVRPTDVHALKMLAAVCLKLGKRDEGEKHLTRAIGLCPGFSAARWVLVCSIMQRGASEEAAPHLRRLIADDPENIAYLKLGAETMRAVQDFPGAIACFEKLLPSRPTAENWLHYGDALRGTRRSTEAIAAYRRAIAVKRDLGQAYWSLANLKTFRFDDAEIEAMLTASETPGIDRPGRSQTHFALGKAFEDRRDYARSFHHYERANAIWRSGLVHDPDEISAWMARSKAVFTSDFLRDRAGTGAETPAPIFVVGLPRSGTTLVEQILASHSMVEGAGELNALKSVAVELAKRGSPASGPYPLSLRQQTPENLRSAGEAYMAYASGSRKLAKPYFVDKMPSNFHHLGLIHLILPNAKIINVRRHPLANGFAIFKQFFPEGQSFAYDQTEIGRYYRDYVAMVAHIDSLLPGRMHSVFYEDLVKDTEGEIRKLLNYCNLPFEDAVLRFHETERPVMTISSEQVRRPIFADAVSQWTHYEPWLAPLKLALGDALDAYPSAVL